MRHAIVMEQAEDQSWCVHVPDLPGCFSWGATREEAARNAREAIQGHIAVMREFGEPVPDGLEDGAVVEIVEVSEGR